MCVCKCVCTMVSTLLTSCWHDCDDVPLMRSPVFTVSFKHSQNYGSCERSVNVMKALGRNCELPDISEGSLVKTDLRFIAF
jgi:hypothetical protein